MEKSYHKRVTQPREQSQPMQTSETEVLSYVSTGCVSVFLRLKLQNFLGNDAKDALVFFCAVDYCLKQSNQCAHF